MTGSARSRANRQPVVDALKLPCGGDQISVTEALNQVRRVFADPRSSATTPEISLSFGLEAATIGRAVVAYPGLAAPPFHHETSRANIFPGVITLGARGGVPR